MGLSKTAVVNVFKERPDVYIGRWTSAPTVREQWGELPGLDGDYGNPHPVGLRCSVCSFEAGRSIIHATNEGALAAFRKTFNELIEEPLVRSKVRALRGRKLGCFCKPKACHGDVYVEWLEANP